MRVWYVARFDEGGVGQWLALTPDTTTLDGGRLGEVYSDIAAILLAMPAEETNDQMLAVIPSTLLDENGNPDVINPNNQSELRRFFVGPNDCEVTGLAFTDNYQNFFINVQHPRNWPSSSDATIETETGVTVRPRASTVAIRCIDGGAVGV